MTDRRRNLFILLLVAGLLAGVGCRDLRHEADASWASTCRAASSSSTRPSRPRSSRRSRPRRSTARWTSCASASTTSASPSPRSSASARTRSPSACRTSRRRRAPQQVGTPPSCSSTTGSRTSSGADGKPTRPTTQRHRRPSSRSAGALRRGRAGRRSAPPTGRRQQHAASAGFYAVDDGSQAGPQRRPPADVARPTALEDLTDDQASRAARSLEVQQGTLVVRGRAARRPRRADAGRAGTSSPTTRRSRGTDIKNPEQNFDQPAGNGSRSSRSTSRDDGRDVWQEVTREIAQRGADKRSPARHAGRGSQHFAIVLDNELISAPYHRLPREPGRHRRLQRLADPGRLHDPVRPGPREPAQDRRPADQARADLALAGLGDARPAGARPGPDRRRWRLRHRRALPARLLPRAGRRSPAVALVVYGIYLSR